MKHLLVLCGVSGLLHRFIVGWRKYAPLPILIIQIISQIWLPSYITGCLLALWLTVPCRIKIINCKWYLWYPRQLVFATLLALYFLQQRL
jgi:hypothetical protein